MYHTTGFTRDQISELCIRVHERFPVEVKGTGRKNSLGLYKRIAVTLTYMRRNHVQDEIAEYYNTSQATISRAITGTTPMLVEVLADWVPTADDLDPQTQLIIDGTLLPCWSWHDAPELLSGKHRTTGMNTLLACTLSGTLAWVSDPMPGKTHDVKLLRTSGLLDVETDVQHLGDKGFIGLDMLTPFRKPPGGELLDWQKRFNEEVNSIRAKVERVIANFKTWRILHVDYRRPLKSFAETISAVVALEFYRMAF